MSKESNIREWLVSIISNFCFVPSTEITDESRLYNDLGFDDLDVWELSSEIEEHFYTVIPSDTEDGWVTVGDVMNYLNTKEANNG